uniref:tRNA-uridine aminocarboxypropyltransferase n=2 Tax=Solanum lycopersicum TaxID=4081 RepID=A0A3Q7IC15_SOLLC
MVNESGHSKRPMCPSCSKPTRLCLCTRLKTPCLENSVAVTILQHSLEKNHPLNSTRIASIGLQNLSVISVSDVNYEAEFVIRLLNSNLEMGSRNLDDNSRRNHKDSNFDSNAAVSFTIEKYGAISTSQNQHLNKPWEQSLAVMQGKTLHSGSLSAPSCASTASREASDDIRKGFLVKKLQRKLLDGGCEFQESKEFEISVPSGSVLLFPSENSIGTEEIDFEVKNLIVLDGTWAKAKRMYNENPWLKMLPHLRLDVEKLSLYSEVRRQPRAGYLSTIESIVYALKAVGEKDCEGLDHLLDVFESMVVDQRRCKDEGLRQRFSNCD